MASDLYPGQGEGVSMKFDGSLPTLPSGGITKGN
jgi:hypothetical protein